MKLIIGSLIVFSLVIVFLFALFPSEVSVTRMIQIRNSADKIHHKLADMREWNWNAFVYDAFPLRFPVSYGAGIIDSSHISLRNVSVELIQDTPDSIGTRWQHGSRYFISNFILTPDTSGPTVLQWTLHFHVKWYPWDKLASMFYDKQLGPMMEKSLVNLRNELETP